MEIWVQNVIAKWTAEGVKLNPPACLAEIVKVETVLGFEFPEDFKEFYLAANGFQGLDWQEHMFTFWPLEMMIEEFEGSKDIDFVGFCDFLLASNCIGFRRTKPGIYKVYPSIDYIDMVPIAQTFEEVILLINSSSESVY